MHYEKTVYINPEFKCLTFRVFDYKATLVVPRLESQYYVNSTAIHVNISSMGGFLFSKVAEERAVRVTV